MIAADYAEVTRMGETKFRKLVGFPIKGDSFLSWPANAFRKARDGDTIILVDCRPAEKLIDLLVSPPSGGVSRTKVRSLNINDKLAKWVGESATRRIWNGCSP